MTAAKVMFLARSLNYGGAERQLVALAKGLHETGYPVLVTLFYRGGPLEEDLQRVGVPVYGLEKRGRWDILGCSYRLWRLLRHERPAVLHGYLEDPNLLATLVKPFFPKTWIIWGVRDSNIDIKQQDWVAGLSFKLSCWLARFADLIIVNSHAGKNHRVCCGYPVHKMVVISNGIDIDRFRPDPAAGRRLRTEWGVSEADKLIGVVARLDPMKDHPTFLRAAALLARQRCNVRFVCIGEGASNYREKLQALSKSIGLEERVIWAGARGDMPCVYNALDLLVSASAYGEGFSNVIGEAMACGVACVVTDVGDSAWIVGEVGRVVPPGEPRALCMAILDALQMMESGAVSREMERAGRMRVMEHFTMQVLIGSFLQSVRQLSKES